jgi:hypothetical protein
MTSGTQKTRVPAAEPSCHGGAVDATADLRPLAAAVCCAVAAMLLTDWTLLAEQLEWALDADCQPADPTLEVQRIVVRRERRPV